MIMRLMSLKFRRCLSCEDIASFYRCLGNRNCPSKLQLDSWPEKLPTVAPPPLNTLLTVGAAQSVLSANASILPGQDQVERLDKCVIKHRLVDDISKAFLFCEIENIF